MSREFPKMSAAYRAAHPDVDWDNHQVFFGKDRDGIWYARGHRFIDDAERAFLERIRTECCSPGECGSHPENSVPEVEGTTGT